MSPSLPHTPQPQTRKAWIDLLRGGCMVAILWFHTEMYYAGHELTPYSLYVTDALCLFFFISGYLFQGNESLRPASKWRSIARKLLLPYFIFTFLMAGPKGLVHGTGFSIEECLVPILTGQASWFISALIVAEGLFTLLVYAAQKWGKWILPTGSLGAFALFLVIDLATESPNPWHFQNALFAQPLLWAGHWFRRHEGRFATLVSWRSLFLMGLAWLAVKFFAWKAGTVMMLEPLYIENYLLFFLNTLTCIAFWAFLSQRLPIIKPLNWTGARSIVYYFFCGGVPLLVGKLLDRAGLPCDGHYARVLLAFALVYALSSALTFLIFRYVPFITGRRQ